MLVETEFIAICMFLFTKSYVLLISFESYLTFKTNRISNRIQSNKCLKTSDCHMFCETE